MNEASGNLATMLQYPELSPSQQAMKTLRD